MLRYMNSIPDLTDLFFECDTGEAALHESCSYFNTSQFQSQRAEFQEFVRTKIIERYDVLYADITDLQVKLAVYCRFFFCIVLGNQCYHSQSRENGDFSQFCEFQIYIIYIMQINACFGTLYG